MAYVFRGIPPRILQRILDNRSGRIPGRNRTGDRTRARWAVDAYDDRRTVVFDTNQIVSFPQKLQSGSIHDNYLPILDPTGQFSAVTASVVAGVSDSLIFQQANVSTMGPWVEDYVPEQGQTSQYWLTGTTLEIGEGFTGQLRDKTIIRKILPVDTQYQMLSLTASMVYYNNETKTFDLAGAGTGWETSNPKVVSGPGYFNIAGIRDARLFGPYGNNIISGSNALGDTPSFVELYIRNGSIQKLLSTIAYSGTLLNKNFAASDVQTFTFDDITEPFLLEKIQIRIPFAMGYDWFNDITRVMGGTNNYAFDCGGPAITVALQRQDLQFRRELICSSTVIPQGDAIYSKDYARLLADASPSATQSLPSDPEPGKPYSWPAGFVSFATPGKVIEPNINDQFTGTVTLNPDVAISNGFVSLALRQAFSPSDFDTSFANSIVLGINPYGRAMDLRPSGRSYFGKEYTSIDLKESPKKPFYEESISPISFYRVYNIEKSSHSPYVILPNDKFILSITKYRSIMNQYATSSFGNYSSIDLDRAILSGSHDVMLNTGSIELIMYGSLISSQHQYHHGLNQQLTSLSTHESIGAKAFLDQFDVEAPIVFSGSYIDDIITGTLGYDENGVLRNDRGVVASIVGAQYLLSSRAQGYQNLPPNVTSSGSLLRGIVMYDENETYYDSLVPSIYDTQRIDEGDVWSPDRTVLPVQGTSSVGRLNFVHIGSHIPKAGANTTWENITGSDWNESYPFQSKYASLRRYRYDKFGGQNTRRVEVRSGFYDASGRFGGIQSAKKYTLSRMIKYDTTVGNTYTWDTVAVLANNLSVFPTGVLPINTDIVAKATYGFGNDKQIVYEYLDTDGDGVGDTTSYVKNNSPRWTNPDPLNQSSQVTISPPGTDPPFPTYPYLGYVSGSNSRPVIVHVYRDVEIEGWKYGLKSGYPTPPRVIFSRNHHGYLRDTLEQRPFTKYVVDGKIEGGPVLVKFTLPDPKDTDSSNLHFEATSSLPYFDGDTRNRTTSTTKFNLIQVPIPGLNNSGQLTINDLIP